MFAGPLLREPTLADLAERCAPLRSPEPSHSESDTKNSQQRRDYDPAFHIGNGTRSGESLETEARLPVAQRALGSIYSICMCR